MENNIHDTRFLWIYYSINNYITIISYKLYIFCLYTLHVQYNQKYFVFDYYIELNSIIFKFII